jgi:LAGLIDADG endonuclease
MSSEAKLPAEWVTGFTDGEGCFHVGVNPHPDMTLGFQVLPEFTIVQHRRDEQLLHKLKAFFGCGVVRSNHGDRLAYRVRSVQHLQQVIIPFFDAHPLRSRKQQDFLKFRRILLLMSRGEHLTPEGLAEIRSVSAEMNRGSVKIESSPLETDGTN